MIRKKRIYVKEDGIKIDIGKPGLLGPALRKSNINQLLLNKP